MITNIVVFCITFLISVLVYHYGSKLYYLAKRKRSPTGRKLLLRYFLIALACLPFDINGNKISILGGGTSEKSFYSMTSIWQEAKGNSFSIIEVGYRKSKNNLSVISLVSNIATSNNTTSLLKILSMNEVKGSMFTGISILSDKESTGNATVLISAISADVSESGKNNSVISILNFQRGGKETFSGIGLSLAIDSPKHERWLAPALMQTGDKNGKRFFVLY